MSITLVRTASGTVASGAAITFDSTGADLIVVTVGFSNNATMTMVDSKGNTPVALTKYFSSLNATSQIWYITNLGANVGSGHQLTLSGGGTAVAATVRVYSGAHFTAPFTAENGSGATGGTTIRPGSITPPDNNSVVVTGYVGLLTGTPETVDSSFINLVAVSGTPNWAVASADLIQTTAAAVNPTWSTNSIAVQQACSIASFKSTPAAPPTPNTPSPWSVNPIPMTVGPGGIRRGSPFRLSGLPPVPFFTPASNAPLAFPMPIPMRLGPGGLGGGIPYNAINAMGVGTNPAPAPPTPPVTGGGGGFLRRRRR